MKDKQTIILTSLVACPDIGRSAIEGDDVVVEAVEVDDRYYTARLATVDGGGARV